MTLIFPGNLEMSETLSSLNSVQRIM